MRIISGKLGGRQFHAPPGNRTHPMSDKMRGALFNTLGDINSSTVLDTFAGSGALSFEAVSRGAAHVTAIEIDKNAHTQVLKNIKTLEIEDKVKAVRANVSGWSDNNPEARFDLVLLDPPYEGISLLLISKMSLHAKNGGLVVLSYPGDKQPPNIKGFDLITAKLYGDSQLAFYRKK